MSRSFKELIEARWAEDRFVCVGLDVDLDRVPTSVRHAGVAETIFEFNRRIIDGTHDLVAAYKPNLAFYERHDCEGLRALRDTVAFIHHLAPNVPVILDAKRGDIDSTNRGYVAAIKSIGGDAVTIHPYLGREAMAPFIEEADLGIFVLCRTSNAGAGEFQDLRVDGNRHLYELVADRVSSAWNKHSNCGLVVGATFPNELARVRDIAPDLPILIPGVGAQGGEVTITVRAGVSKRGDGIIVNSSRGILYASSGSDFVEAARRAVEELHTTILAARS